MILKSIVFLVFLIIVTLFYKCHMVKTRIRQDQDTRIRQNRNSMLFDGTLIFVLLLFGIFNVAFAQNSNNAENFSPELKSFLDNFKAVSMHFIDPFLKNIKVKDFKMEGFVRNDITPIVAKLMKQSAISSNDDTMKSFAEALEKSYDVCEKAYMYRNDPSKSLSLTDIQKLIFPKDKRTYTAIPAGWLGPLAHGILLIIEKNDFQFFDLVVINTGLGLKYHNSRTDHENKVAPQLFRVWKKFNRIPKIAFTEGNNWFLQALGFLNDNDEMMLANKNGYKPEKHFYETILGNFKQYEANDDLTDDKFITAQYSGTCAYSSLTAGLLYVSKDKNDFLTRKYIYGLTLLKDFLDKCENLDFVKEILGDAYEPMARYLMKHLASGVAFQTLELLEFNNIKLGYADLLSSRNNAKMPPSLNDLKNFVPLKHIQTAVKHAVRIHKLLSDNKVDAKSALIVHQDISNCSPDRISKTVFNRAALALSKEDIEKLQINENNWPGTRHPYISSESEYTRFFPEYFSTLSQLASKLEEITKKSSQMQHLDSIMNTYLYDFFKIARSNIDELINFGSKDDCSKILQSAKKIMRNFMEESILPMAVEDLAAMTQLLVLTWKAAKKFDSMSFGLYDLKLGLDKYSAPFSSDLFLYISKPYDPNDIESSDGTFKITDRFRVNLDTCAAAPIWLTTEDEYEAWIMFQQGKSELAPTDNQPSIFDPRLIFPNMYFIQSSATVLNEYKPISILEKIVKNYESTYKTSISMYQHSFEHKELTGPYLAIRGILDPEKYPQYFNLIDVATCFYFGPWYRPFGHSKEENFVFAQYKVKEMVFGPYINVNKPKRGKPSYPPFLRDSVIYEFMKYRKKAFDSAYNSDFALEQFFGIRAANALHYSQTEVRFYAFLSLIEGAKSCAFFEHSSLVFMADRLLGIEIYFNNEPNFNLIKRTREALQSMISNEMLYFKTNHEMMEMTKKEKHLDRMLNAELVYLRFLIRLEAWKLVKSKSDDIAKTIANIYDEWAPLGMLKSNYELAEDMIGKINIFLWDCVNSTKQFKEFDQFSKAFVSNLSEYKSEDDAEDIINAHISYRYFIAAAFSKKVAPSQNFDLLTKIYQKLRRPPSLKNQNSAEIALRLISQEMVSFYEPIETDLDKYWNYAIDEKFKFIEIKKKESKSKIPFILLRISTGRIILNGIAVIHKSKIYNHPVFRRFFSKKDHAHALNGSIKPIGDKIGYSLSNFRGTGQNFLFITDGGEKAMDIFYYHNKDRWLWSNPDNKSTKSFLQRLRLMNINGIRIYQKYYVDQNLLEAIFMKGYETEPLYHLKIENVNEPAKSKIKMKLPFIEKQVLLLNPEQAAEKLNKAFIGFSQPEYISVYSTEDNRAVIMYGPYRFTNEEVPIIFEEQIDESDPENPKKIFVLLNHNNWCLDEDQIIGGGKLFLGTIKLRSVTDPENKAILVPNILKIAAKDEVSELIEKQKKEKEGKREAVEAEIAVMLNVNLITVEIIKISKGELMPKDRYERLVLAYKFMINLETDMARKLLHPIQSIDQNSPFNEEELKMLKWILEFETNNPEIYALKMMAGAHYYINALNYISNKRSFSPRNIIASTSYNYLTSLRQISNKFYLHRLFPEVIENKELFEYLFNFQLLDKINGLKLIAGDSDAETALNFKIGTFLNSVFFPREENKPKEFDLTLFDWRKINFTVELNEKNFFYLFELIRNNPDVAKNYYRIYYRRNEVPEVTTTALDSFDFELLLYCSQSDIKFPRDPKNLNILEVLFKLAKDRGSALNNDHETAKIKTVLNDCLFGKRDELIKQIVQPIDSSLIITKIEETKNIFINDLKENKISDDFVVPKKEFISKEILDKFSELITLIRDFSIKKTKIISKNAKGMQFFDEARSSLVLTKLRHSIIEFNKIVPIEGSIEVDLKSKETKDISDKLVKLQVALKNLIDTHDEEFKHLATELAKDTNTENITDDTDLITNLSFLKHFKKSKTFESLYGCYYSRSWECFVKKFPHITEDKAKEIRDKTHIFYSKNVLQDYYNFMKEKMDKLIEAKIVSLADLTEFVNEAEKLDQFSTRIEIPGILNFEFKSKKYRLREEQTKDLQILTTKSGSGMFQSIVIQRMMAAGKTLILGTLATVIKARETGILSILVPPSSLFQSNAASMLERTYNYFKSRGVVLSFERVPLPTNEKSVDQVLLTLNWFNDNLKLTRETKNYLVMSPDTLQSFLNSYIEFLNYYTSFTDSDPMQKLLEPVLESYAKSYEIFMTQASIILDEIDMTMNPKKELNYPTTNRETYNLIAVALTTDLIEFSIFSKKILNLNLNILRNNQAGLTPLAYDKIKSKWLDYIEESLGDKKSLWNQKLLTPRHDKLTKESIMNFLKSDDISKYSSWVDEMKNSSDNILQLNAIIIMKRQIDVFLQDSFKSTVKEHFGPAGPSRPNIKYAVPYVAANTPSESSLFADRWETLNKSLLMAAVIGLDESDYVNFIFWLKEQVNMESISTGASKITATYENFSALIEDLNPLSINFEDPAKMKLILTELDKKNRAAIRLIFSFYLDTVISKLEFPTEQITSNALHMTSMFASVQGYSGTIDNINILPSEVVPAAYLDHILNENNNGGIVQKLILDSNNMPAAVVNGMDSIKSARVNVKKLLKAIPEDELVNLSALIDVGAFFKNFRNAKVAEALLRTNSPRIKCVLYYDEISNMLQYVVEKIKIRSEANLAVLSEAADEASSHKSGDEKKKWEYTHGKLTLSDPESIKKITGYDLSERFTFYDQRHITGSDIVQPLNAISLLTFSSRNLLRDILQGALRMRQFMTTQRVFFVITPDVVTYYNSLLTKDLVTLTTSNVIALSAFNEDEKQGRENAALSFVKIDVKVRSGILRTITENIKNKKIADIIDPFKKARSLFIRNFSENPVSWVKKTISVKAKTSLQNFIDSRKKLIEQPLLTELKDLVKDCNPTKLVTNSILCFAPENLPEYNSDKNMNSEMQLELNTLQLNEFELEAVNQDSKFKDVMIAYPRFRLNECTNLVTMGLYSNFVKYSKIIHDTRIIQKSKDLIQASLFKTNLDHILFSRDLVNIVNTATDVCPFDLFSSFNLEGTHIFIVNNNTRNVYELLLVSNDVADQIRADNSPEFNFSCGIEWYLVDLMGNIILSKNSQFLNKNILNLKNNNDFNEQFFNLLIINGSLLQLSSQPILKSMFFKKWVKNQGMNGGLSFLMIRMRVLQEKLRFLFDSEDPLISTISKAISGDTEALHKLTTETYNSHFENLKKIEKAKSSGSLNLNVIHRALGVYDKVSIKREVANTDLVFVNEIGLDEVTEGGIESDSDDDSIDGMNNQNDIDMLDILQLKNILDDPTVLEKSDPSSKNFKEQLSKTKTNNSISSSTVLIIVIVLLIILASIGVTIYFCFIKLSDTEIKKDDNEDENTQKSNYESDGIHPVMDTDSYSTADADNIYGNNTYNTYYNANSGYQNTGYNGYENNSNYYNSNYNNVYNNDGYSNYNNSSYNHNNNFGPLPPDYTPEPPSSPPEYKSNKIADFSSIEKDSKEKS